MSQLIDKLNKASKITIQPMGFASSRAVQPKAKMLLIAAVPPDNVDDLPGIAEGADAVLINFGNSAPNNKALKKLKQLSDIIWGASVTEPTTDSVNALLENKADFVVFPLESSLPPLYSENKLGKIILADSSLAAELLRMVNELPVDAAFATMNGNTVALTWRNLLHYQRIAHLVDKPLIIAAPPDLSTDELKLLWEMGVDCISIETNKGKKLKELREAIDKPDFLPARKHVKVEAILPRIRPEAEPIAEDEEEEEEEDD